MEIDQWISQMKKKLQEITGAHLLQLLASNDQVMGMIAKHFAIVYAKDKLGDRLTDDMGRDGWRGDDPDQIIRFIQNNKEIYRDYLIPKNPVISHMEEEFLTLPGFPAVVEILAKTENVNRSNVSAVLAVASRRSDELKVVVEQIQLHFEKDLDQIALFFKQYFEEVKGWRFNKMNRRESEGGMEVMNNMTQQLACWILLESEADAIKAFKEVAE